ncbi:MAG: aminotransferase class I/II-fold pyridoxal phosphate-dependent enzyme [Candidatus Cloacimonetes bacterium]|nr:aminotransferase class I/II-fold pyridoxal phosphate-dependent enzyme [Candidatus Cloacimonadota bacterium]MCF7868222.1 aminotransferase class I/II-fold pyridoxal phosphate-dependent enzyme [Candidatus Cloacimonadota bacterium]MCF7883655.1 aminotransferase class I/II-fold pyridoxal phosphate-dependent enzyme [Candidatus Cloacimonadota bacterium]
MYLFRDDLKNKKPVNINVPKKTVKLGLNESNLNPLDIVRERFLEKMKNVPLNRYFNDITNDLFAQLSDYTGVPEDHLAMGNGADEMLFYIFTAVRNNNSSFAVSLAPSYFDYRSYSGAVGLGIKFQSLLPDFDFDVQKYNEFANFENCKLVILCNPNNPTGNLLDEEKIIKVIKANRNRLVLIDETYFEFSGKTFADRIAEFPNLIIVRSFSKAFSAAGLRFGYVISQPQNIKELNKVMTIFHLNLMTQTYVSTILENKEIFLKHNQKVIEQKEIVYSELAKIDGISVHPSATNFITFSAGKRSEELFEFISKNDIAIRPVWQHPVLKEHLRVTISGDEAENRLFLEKVKEFY